MPVLALRAPWGSSRHHVSPILIRYSHVRSKWCGPLIATPLSLWDSLICFTSWHPSTFSDPASCNYCHLCIMNVSLTSTFLSGQARLAGDATAVWNTSAPRASRRYISAAIQEPPVSKKELRKPREENVGADKGFYVDHTCIGRPAILVNIAVWHPCLTPSHRKRTLCQEIFHVGMPWRSRPQTC